MPDPVAMTSVALLWSAVCLIGGLVRAFFDGVPALVLGLIGAWIFFRAGRPLR